MRGSVLIVDDNPAISQVVAEVLREEGFVIAELSNPQPAAVRAEVTRLEPDAVLLDGSGAAGYGGSWVLAAWMHERNPPIPAIMFTAHANDVAEGRLKTSQRSKRAAFAGFVLKPFDLLDLVETVGHVIDHQSFR